MKITLKIIPYMLQFSHALCLPASDSLPGGGRVEIKILHERLRLPGRLFLTACGTVRIPERAV